MSCLESLKYQRGSLEVLNQLQVPHDLTYRPINSVHDAVDSIKRMEVRGAPLIATVGTLAIASVIHRSNDIQTICDLRGFLETSVKALIDARPTAVNMQKEGTALLNFAQNIPQDSDIKTAKEEVINYIEHLLKVDVDINKAIGRVGVEEILKISQGANVSLLTHCNTGSLATAGYGTALGVFRALFEKGVLNHGYCTETRPYNQGARLTSFELLHEGIPSTLICDSAVSWLLKNKKIDGIVVGADRVVKNGDTANKIGTYQLAISAKYHQVPFYIAAPTSTLCEHLGSGEEIEVEERNEKEITHFNGQLLTPQGVKAWNPAFDVTPANLITGIFTEKGFFKPEEIASLINSMSMK